MRRLGAISIRLENRIGPRDNAATALTLAFLRVYAYGFNTSSTIKEG